MHVGSTCIGYESQLTALLGNLNKLENRGQLSPQRDSLFSLGKHMAEYLVPEQCFKEGASFLQMQQDAPVVE